MRGYFFWDIHFCFVSSDMLYIFCMSLQLPALSLPGSVSQEAETQKKSVISFPTGFGFSPLDQAHILEAGKRIMSRYPFIHISPCFIMSCCLACYQKTSSIWLLLYLILASLNLWLVLVLCCYFHKSGAWSLEAFSKPCFYHCEESFYKFPFMTKLEYVCVSYQDPDWFNCYSYISIFYSNNLEKL